MRGLLCRFLCVALCLVALPLSARDGRRMLDAQEAAEWRGVGRLNIAGRRFCTATLIAPDIALTAAHCLYNPRTKQLVRVSEILFVAGLRLGAHAASRRVRAAAIMPDYAYDGAANLRTLASDVALVALDAPVAVDVAQPFAVGAFDADSGDITVVSYARDRAHAPSIENDCGVRHTQWPIAALDCDVTQGASGAPVFDAPGGGDAPRIVAVVSALGRNDGDAVALTVAVDHLIAPLMAALGGSAAAR